MLSFGSYFSLSFQEPIFYCFIFIFPIYSHKKRYYECGNSNVTGEKPVALTICVVLLCLDRWITLNHLAYNPEKEHALDILHFTIVPLRVHYYKCVPVTVLHFSIDGSRTYDTKITIQIL